MRKSPQNLSANLKLFFNLSAHFCNEQLNEGESSLLLKRLRSGQAYAQHEEINLFEDYISSVLTWGHSTSQVFFKIIFSEFSNLNLLKSFPIETIE